MKHLRFLPKKDGWRTAAQAYLRTEHTKFILAAFRLNFWSDGLFEEERKIESSKKHIIERLSLFFKNHPLPYGKLSWGKFSTRGMKKKYSDIVCADFNDEGTLKEIWPFLDPARRRFKFICKDKTKRLHDLMVEVYNQVLHIKDDLRPRCLKNELREKIFSDQRLSENEIEESLAYLEIILSSTFIHFEILAAQETRPAPNRFKPPNFIWRKHPGFGVMNICCRLTADFSETDLWFQISHVAIDGVPMQDILNILKSQWKTSGDLVFPSAAHSFSEVTPVRCTTESGKIARYYADQMIDFRPLLKARDEMNAFYGGQLLAPMTVISMLGWGLAHQPFFFGRRFLFPVDLPSVCEGERTLGFVSICPSHFINNFCYKDPFLAYQQEFHRKLSKTCARINGVYKLFELSALLPPFAYWFVQKFMKILFSKVLGSIVITMIKDADFFAAPFSDVIQDGFIAIGNYSIPTEDNERVGLVSAKSTKEKVVQYLSAVKFVVADFNRASRRIPPSIPFSIRRTPEESLA